MSLLSLHFNYRAYSCEWKHRWVLLGWTHNLYALVKISLRPMKALPTAFIAPRSLKLCFYLNVSCSVRRQQRWDFLRLCCKKLRLYKCYWEKACCKTQKQLPESPCVHVPPPFTTPSSTQPLIPLSAAFSLPRDHAGRLQRPTLTHTRTHSLFAPFRHMDTHFCSSVMFFYLNLRCI